MGICIYKTSLPHQPDDNTDFTPSCPPHFTTKLRPWVEPEPSWESLQ